MPPASDQQEIRTARPVGIASRLASPELRWCVMLAVLTLALYGRVIAFPFINFDDDVHVYENPHVRSGLTWPGFLWAFKIHGPSQWHPLAWLSHQLDWQIYGDRAGGHHATNLALHLVGVWLLFFAMRELLGRLDSAAFIAAMFAVHPLNIESVAWVSERRNVLCGVFWMLSLIAYARYARFGDWKRYLLVTLWLTLALMSKPLAVTLPCVFALLDFWPLRRCRLPGWLQPAADGCRLEPCPTRSWRFLMLEKLPWLAMSAAASWLSYLCQEKIRVVSSLGELPVALRLENACAAYGLYLRRMIWPLDLAVFYPHPAWHDPHPEQALLVPALCGAAVLLAITAAACWRLRANPAGAVGWCWFLGTLVPMIGIVQVGQQQLADRYAYIPMIGLGLMTVGFSASVRSTTWLRRLAVIAVIGWFGVSAWQLGYWQNSRTLFARTAAITDQNNWARLNLGLAFAAEGKYDQAIASYQEALRIDPRYELAYYNLGIVWHDLRRPDLAVRYFERAVALNPHHVEAWIRLGGAAGQLGDLDRADAYFRQAISLDEQSAQARFNLGLVLQARGQLKAALAQLRQAIELAPHSVHFRTGWMLALEQAGEMQAARQQAREVLRQDPNSVEARRLLAP